MERLNLLKNQISPSLTAEKKGTLKGKKKESATGLMPYYVTVNKKCPEMTPREGYSLKGKVAVITGGNRGIGFSTAEHLAMEGCNIVIGAKTVVSGPKTVETIYWARDELMSKYGVKVLAVKCDA